MLEVVEVLGSQVATSGGLSRFADDVVEWRVKSETTLAVLAEPSQYEHGAHVSFCCGSLWYQPKWWMGVFAFPSLGGTNSLEIVQADRVGVVAVWDLLLGEAVGEGAVWLTCLVVCCGFGVWTWEGHGPGRG